MTGGMWVHIGTCVQNTCVMRRASLLATSGGESGVGLSPSVRRLEREPVPGTETLGGETEAEAETRGWRGWVGVGTRPGCGERQKRRVRRATYGGWGAGEMRERRRERREVWETCRHARFLFVA